MINNNKPSYQIFIYSVFACFLLFGCKSVNDQVLTAGFDDYTLLDTLSVTASRVEKSQSNKLPVYRSSIKKELRLIHTALDLSFDWEKEQVIGTAALTLSAHFNPVSIAVLDAVNFKINSITQGDMALQFDYDENQVHIKLPRPLKKDQEITLKIDYIASPSHFAPGNRPGEKGLYFINPRNEDRDKPRQLWTQGETQYNSRWFPTIDASNQRSSQETKLTVESKLETLSNGKLISSVDNKNGTRTDTWSQNLSHPPYLFMVAVGDYAIVKDKWKDKELLYYVEPEYKDDARAIFAHTSEMLDFFSEKFQYEFPWDKYAQIIVRDFVAGAMENTTAVTFMQSVQQHAEDLDEIGNDGIVAHELSHHWFGNIVTCESWANLTLNEGFANYSEYLWYEYKYGADRANHNRLQELNTYLWALQRQGKHPLIHFMYKNKEDMFDTHSYNKGGLVLHMLRKYVGDEMFFASLGHYLKENEYTDVELDELRLSFEEITGEDLNWFFNQWFMFAGHPELNVAYQLDTTRAQLTITTEQTQDSDTSPGIYQLPVEIALYQKDGTVVNKEIWINQRKQEFTLNVSVDFAFAVFDADRELLVEFQESNNTIDPLLVFNNPANYVVRKDALLSLDTSEKAYLKALKDPYYHIRIIAIRNLDLNDKTKAEIQKIADNDPNEEVRHLAKRKLE